MWEEFRNGTLVVCVCEQVSHWARSGRMGTEAGSSPTVQCVGIEGEEVRRKRSPVVITSRV